MKAKSKVMLFVLALGMSLWLCSTAFADYSMRAQRPYQPQDTSHIGLYLGAGIGAEIPTGPDQNGLSTGFGWAIRLGYQFIKNLAIELGYDQGIGSGNSGGTSLSWTFMETPYLNIKPIIPLSSADDIYFLLGAAYAQNQETGTIGGTSLTATLGPDITYDLGIGYEHYIARHWSLGVDVIYHRLATTKASASPGGSVTLPYALDGSVMSANIGFLYHF